MQIRTWLTHPIVFVIQLALLEKIHQALGHFEYIQYFSFLNLFYCPIYRMLEVS
jgi:hypothetical protein